MKPERLIDLKLILFLKRLCGLGEYKDRYGVSMTYEDASLTQSDRELITDRITLCMYHIYGVFSPYIWFKLNV